MTLINTDGLVLIGAGSEWFWAAAQFAAVAVSLIAIYRQIRGQGAANAMQRIQTIDARWSSPRMAHTRLEVAMHLRYQKPDPACYHKARPILDFLADLQHLQVDGYLSLKEIDASWGRAVQEWVAFTAPLVEERRRKTDRSNIYDLESFINKLRAMERKRNVKPLRSDVESLQGLLDEEIDRASAILQQEAAWQSGKVPEVPVRPTATAETRQD